MSEAEAVETFGCFGSTCAVLVTGDGPQATAGRAAADARDRLLQWHERFSRFLPESELSHVNRDRRACVPVSPLMARLAEAVLMAGTLTDGLVDGTLLAPLQAAGYTTELARPLALAQALPLAAPRRPARPDPARRWQQIEVDFHSGTLTRPPGLMIDSGGLAKGLFADVLADPLSAHESFAVNCAGDLAIGGWANLERPIEVQSPFDASTLHTFLARRTGVATSGIGRRSWLDPDGAPAHHLLDPSSGRPAFTGVVQVSALAPSALLAEVLAKAALLAGRRQARRWLPHGGVVVFDDGSHEVYEPPPIVTLARPSRTTGAQLRTAEPKRRRQLGRQLLGRQRA